jgi:hypothetical protein
MKKLLYLKKRKITCLFKILPVFLQLLLFQLREHLTVLFYVKNFTSLINDVRCMMIRILRPNFIPAREIVQGFIVLEPSSYMHSSGTNLHELSTYIYMNSQ